MIRAAVEAGKKIDVFADETRPFLQGARLTVWELQQDGIPTTLITDNMAGHFLKSGRIGCVVVGADRIAATATWRTRSGPTRWPCWRRRTACRSMWRRRFRRSI